MTLYVEEKVHQEINLKKIVSTILLEGGFTSFVSIQCLLLFSFIIKLNNEIKGTRTFQKFFFSEILPF